MVKASKYKSINYLRASKWSLAGKKYATVNKN